MIKNPLINENPFSIDLLYQGLKQSLADCLTKDLRNQNLHWKVENFKTSPFSSEQIKSVRLFLLKTDPENFEKDLATLVSIKKTNPNLNILVMGEFSETGQVSSLINQARAFSIIDEKDKLIETLKKAYKNNLDKNQHSLNLKKLKSQNKQLESLNKNLEQIVRDRTRKDFSENKKAESSVKKTKSILQFIRNVSRSYYIQDLMIQMRDEIKNFRGFMPPVFVLKKESKEMRFFYFQRKQFTEKTKWFEKDQGLFKDKNKSFFLEKTDPGFNDFKNHIRSQLSELFGRPYGSVLIHHFDFQSTELKSVEAGMIFEHSQGLQSLEEFQKSLKQKLSIFGMALENILLRQILEDITRQWSETFNKMKDPILIIKQDYQISLSNRQYHTGKDRKCHKNFARSQESCKGCPMEKSLSTGKPHFSDIHTEGRVYRVHSYPIRLTERNSVKYVINQYVDISQSIKLRNHVIQGEKMAAIGLLAGNIAHELNNPLTGIHSLSDLLLDDFEKDSQSYKDLTEIKKGADRCQEIIRNLLDFSSIDGSSGFQIIDINKMVSKTLPLLKVAMRFLNSKINLYPKALPAHCNPQLIQQVIFNLVNNACQAMTEGGELTVTTNINGLYAEIRIKDTGPGIPEEIKNSIFDPFFTTKKEGKGTGLGLSLSKSVIEKSNGSLTLNDNYTEGAEFVISLPLVLKQEP